MNKDDIYEIFDTLSKEDKIKVFEVLLDVLKEEMPEKLKEMVRGL